MLEKYHSEILNADYKENAETGNVHFNQMSLLTGKQITYTPEEIKILSETGGEITPTIHRVKSIFGGVIMRVKKSVEFKDKYNRIEMW